MREVEVKALITNTDILVTNLLLNNAVFVRRIVQEDRIFIQKEKEFLGLGNGDKIFRIRRAGNNFEFNLKIPIANELDCLEYELTIDNAEVMEKILFNLGYIQAISVMKTREIYKLGELTFNIDVVNDLGKFVEIEKLVNGEDISEHQMGLKGILLNLCSSPVEFVNSGYDTLLYKKKIYNVNR